MHEALSNILLSASTIAHVRTRKLFLKEIDSTAFDCEALNWPKLGFYRGSGTSNYVRDVMWLQLAHVTCSLMS